MKIRTSTPVGIWIPKRRLNFLCHNACLTHNDYTQIFRHQCASASITKCKNKNGFLGGSSLRSRCCQDCFPPNPLLALDLRLAYSLCSHWLIPCFLLLFGYQSEWIEIPPAQIHLALMTSLKSISKHSCVRVRISASAFLGTVHSLKME